MIKVFQEIVMHIDQVYHLLVYILIQINLYKLVVIYNLVMSQIPDDNYQDRLRLELQHFHY
jgi:hypothetical protein